MRLNRQLVLDAKGSGTPFAFMPAIVLSDSLSTTPIKRNVFPFLTMMAMG
jgi:hypothetical protein